MVKRDYNGCGKCEEDMLGGWLDVENNCAWGERRCKWNGPRTSHAIYCGHPDLCGDVELMVLCMDCMRRYGFVW